MAICHLLALVLHCTLFTAIACLPQSTATPTPHSDNDNSSVITSIIEIVIAFAALIVAIIGVRRYWVRRGRFKQDGKQARLYQHSQGITNDFETANDYNYHHHYHHYYYHLESRT
ncbi:hypothetical protein BU24DRAFT_406203 [Aaosphaeria arxii CBS 175.79]|uniref:Uncharacterized protein n=1 Tax=Aaosphaeria arxii CBS 175.79 TaxID=1450172 RepID=A0A6A5Y214_9PLEO|nr:uncharacterized protein BU24DRAFT_406203 [Aaosphaeria arxii CBS 175.79]KAF2019542.1 hypothetical protein BU24DRAFT_406203 [Aaosphaeria arxii CBS 175.79]